MAEETKNLSVSKGTNVVNPNKFTMYIILGLIILLITVMIMATILILTFKNIKPGKTTIIQQTIPNSMDVGHNTNFDREFGLLVPLNEIIVNLATSPGGAEHYLKVNITLEVIHNEKVKEEVAKRVPQLRDLVISKLRTVTKDEIDKKEGKDKLSGELLNSINTIVGGGKVRHVFFEDFMIQ